MSVKNTSSIFSVQKKRNLLVVTQAVASSIHTLCSINLRQQPSFYLRNGRVVCRYAEGLEFNIETLENMDSGALLSQLTGAQWEHEGSARRWVGYPLVGALLLALGLSAITIASQRIDLGQSVTAAAVASEDKGRPSVGLEPRQQNAQTIASEPAATQVAPQSAPADTATAGNGWNIPASIQRTQLPERLRMAAERQVFTVNYSSGHSRNLYVFADPGCPNCQRLEPALNSISSSYNVAVFPVSMTGKEQSVAAITPVLCLPPEQRKSAWDALFDPARNGLSLGQVNASVEPKAPDADCTLAEKALAINEVAYQAYRIPGTPWVIADDGRHVPQALLKDPVKLQMFLDGKGAADASE